MFLLLVSCEYTKNTEVPKSKSPCEKVLSKLEECIGAPPFIVGECEDYKVEHLLQLNCKDLLQEIIGS